MFTPLMYILTSVCSAQHSKRWSKNAFSHFLIRKCKKGSIEGKMRQIEVKKWVLGACTRKLIKVYKPHDFTSGDYHH